MQWAVLATMLGVTPADELRAAAADLATLPPQVRATTRYLSLYNVPPAALDETMVAVEFVLNAVSRGRVIARPTRVADTSLVRWNLTDYAAEAKDLAEFSAAYEAIASEDPYWHLRTDVVDPKSNKRETVFTDGGWTDLPAAAALREGCGSAGALLRADWFVAKAAAPPHYYRLVGVPESRSEFLAWLGLDEAASSRLGADAGANLLQSHVTRQVRRIVRRQAPLGGAWETFDVARSTPERDPFRNPFAFKFDAGEHIAAKPNGMHVYALFDGVGKRQDAVPPDIARDDSDPHGDGQVAPLISCVRCHVEDGLRPFSNDQKHLLEAGIDVLADTPERAQRLAQFYAGEQLARQLPRDREDYAAAVSAATGRTPREASAALAAVFRRQVYDLVSPRTAACELGLLEHVDADRAAEGECGDDGFAATAFEALAPLQGSNDPVLLALVAGMSVQRAAWEGSFAEAALLAAGVEPSVAAEARRRADDGEVEPAGTAGQAGSGTQEAEKTAAVKPVAAQTKK